MACKSCGGPHRGWERCPKLRATVGVVVHEEAARSAGSSQPAPMVVHAASRHGVYADPEKRRKYRREWMRAKRAAEKAARQL